VIGTALPVVDRGALLIDRVETLALRTPLTRRFAGSAYSMVNRATIVTRLHTRDGLVSEVYNGDTDAEQPAVLDIIHDELAPRILGRSASDPEGAWAAMAPSTADILRDRGLALQAIACLDTASGTSWPGPSPPAHRVWGSATDSLPMSVIGGYYHLDADAIGRVVAGYATRYSGMKFKVGGSTPAADAERVRLARQAAGPDFVLMVDAHQGYDRAAAIAFARLV
jgi:D-arabinonate dehydratase